MNPGHYIIKDLENLTGIKSHTIRIWEKRYGILTPKRTENNFRYYDEDDLKKILNVNLLYQNGLKISKIAILKNDELLEAAKVIIDENNGNTPHEITLLITASLKLDANEISCILEDLFQQQGIIDMYQNTIKKFLIRIGKLWQLNTFQISHEHLFSNTLRDFITGKIGLLKKTNSSKKVILFLPPEEEHELPLLFYHYLLLDKGWECIYLGQNVPFKDVEEAYLQTNPLIVLTSLIKSTSSKHFKLILKKITEIVPENRICLSGSNTITYKKDIPKGMKIIHNLADFVKVFE
jgi:MerR family transcriptional regulator, light-induced transcriptional regulator